MGTLRESGGTGTTELQVRIERRMDYRVVHTRLPIFAPTNPALARCVGAEPVAILIDTAVERLYGDALQRYVDARGLHTVDLIRCVAREAAKEWAPVDRIVRRLVSRDFPRNGILVSIGGGIVTDVGGMVAAVYRRGVRHVRIPTTLVGLVDAGIGIKQAVNQASSKSIIGCFFPPMAVLNDARFLSTLSRRSVRAGLAEIIKIAVVLSESLFEVLERTGVTLVATQFQRPRAQATDILLCAERLMLREIAGNPYEHELRRLVDFGHSFSPAIEACATYRVMHGEAVASDMLMSTAIGCVQNRCDVRVLRRLASLYRAVGLSVSPPALTIPALQRSLSKARAHRGGALHLVVPSRIGAGVFVQDVPVRDLRDAIRLCASLKGPRHSVDG